MTSMSATDAEWQEWAKKEAARAAWHDKCRQMAYEIERAQLTEQLGQGIQSHVVERLRRQLAEETPAYKSKIKLRLYRLASGINEWRSTQEAPEDAELFSVVVLGELLPLLEEMGLDVSVKQQGGAL
jgi:hypothetical protein